MRVDFIGLGTKGMPMARCLRQQGLGLPGWDVNTVAVQGPGAGAESLESLAAACDCFVIMLPEGEHVAALYRGIRE